MKDPVARAVALQAAAKDQLMRLALVFDLAERAVATAQRLVVESRARRDARRANPIKGG